MLKKKKVLISTTKEQALVGSFFKCSKNYTLLYTYKHIEKKKYFILCLTLPISAEIINKYGM